MDGIGPNPNYPRWLVDLFVAAIKPLMDEVTSLKHELSELKANTRLAQDTSLQIGALQQTLQEFLPPRNETVYEPERHVIKVIIRDDIQAIQAMSREGLLQYVREIGSAYQHVVSVELVNQGPPAERSTTRRVHCFLLLIFLDYEAKKGAREQIQMLYDAFGFTQATQAIRDTYLLEIINYKARATTTMEETNGVNQANEAAEMDRLVRQNFSDLTRGRVLKAMIRFSRVLLETSHLPDALRLDGSLRMIYGQPYRLRAMGVQGIPLFCYNCGKPAHFKYQCNAPQSCSRCSGEHDTRECPVRERRNYACPTCEGKHEAWHTACTDESARDQHRISRQHRQTGPEWARANRPQPTNASSSQAQPGTAPENTATVPSSSEASLSAPSSQEAPRRGRGRPRKGTKPAVAAQQPAAAQPAPKKPNRQDIRDMFQAGSSSSGTRRSVASSSRTTTTASASSSATTSQSNMVQDPSSSQGRSTSSVMEVDCDFSDYEMMDDDRLPATGSTAPADDDAIKTGSKKKNKKWNKGKGKGVAQAPKDKGKGVAHPPEKAESQSREVQVAGPSSAASLPAPKTRSQTQKTRGQDTSCAKDDKVVASGSGSSEDPQVLLPSPRTPAPSSDPAKKRKRCVSSDASVGQSVAGAVAKD
ncbi:hypothetical protein ACHAPA_009478 [Fusarium lateritium]